MGQRHKEEQANQKNVAGQFFKLEIILVVDNLTEQERPYLS